MSDTGYDPEAVTAQMEELLERALPMLEQLGDFIGNGDIDPDRRNSLGARCDLIGDIKDALGLRIS